MSDQDWFAQNAPQQQASGDWFAANAPQQEKPGFWNSLGSDLSRLIAYPSGYSPWPGTDLENKQATAEASKQEAMAREAAGANKVYSRVLAPAIGAAGFNVAGMEQAAQQNNPGAMAGHVVAGALPFAAAWAAPKVMGAVSDTARRGLLLGRTPEEAYQSALKPSTTLAPEKIARAVQTGLQEKIPVSAKGLEKIGDAIDRLDAEVTAQIGSGKGVTISPKAVATRTADTAARFADQVNPEADLSAVNSARDEFLRRHSEQRPYTKLVPSATGQGYAQNPPGSISVETPIPAADAQRIKVGTYAQLRGKYGELGSASIETQKALVRGIKEELEVPFPELKGTNAKLGDFYNLEPLMQRAVARIGNHQLLGIGTPIAAGAVKAVTGSGKLAAIAGVMKAVLDDPMVKSRLAIALSRSGRIPPAAALARVTAYAAALAPFAQTAADQYPAESPSQ